MPYPVDRRGARPSLGPFVPAVVVHAARGIGALPAPLTAAIVAGALVAVTVLDVVTGPDLAVSLFYVLPIIVAAGYLTPRGAALSVVLAGLGVLLAEYRTGIGHSDGLTPWWNAFTRFLIFAMIGLVVSALRAAVEHERELARTDALTGVANARHFFELARREQRRARRYRTPLTIAYVDLDAFKSINDRHGHDVGDRVLCATADALAVSVREIDVVARIGGDEFALLLPQADAAGARIVMERVEAELGTIRAEGEPVRWSIGVVTFPAPADDVEDLLRASDRLMYSVKQGGGGMRFATIAPASTRAHSPFRS